MVIKFMIMLRLLIGLVAFFSISCHESSEDKKSIVSFSDTTFEKSARLTGMPFSKKCNLINYYFRSGGLQDLAMLCRFSCRESDLTAIIKEFVDWNDKQIGKVATRKIASTPPYSLQIVPVADAKSIKWWNVADRNIIYESLCKDGFGCNFWVSKSVDGFVDIYMYQSS